MFKENKLQAILLEVLLIYDPLPVLLEIDGWNRNAVLRAKHLVLKKGEEEEDETKLCSPFWPMRFQNARK
jgi:hypothetical protein